MNQIIKIILECSINVNKLIKIQNEKINICLFIFISYLLNQKKKQPQNGINYARSQATTFDIETKKKIHF